MPGPMPLLIGVTGPLPSGLAGAPDGERKLSAGLTDGLRTTPVTLPSSG